MEKNSEKQTTNSKDRSYIFSKSNVWFNEDIWFHSCFGIQFIVMHCFLGDIYEENLSSLRYVVRKRKTSWTWITENKGLGETSVDLGTHLENSHTKADQLNWRVTLVTQNKRIFSVPIALNKHLKFMLEEQTVLQKLENPIFAQVVVLVGNIFWIIPVFLVKCLLEVDSLSKTHLSSFIHFHRNGKQYGCTCMNRNRWGKVHRTNRNKTTHWNRK